MFYDGFTFFNELDLLELRLKVLSEHVDKFIIAESAYTFTGKKKKYNFEENRERYSKYDSQIIYIKVDKFPDTCVSAWDREAYQRNAIAEGFETSDPDDIYLISDLDEIPNSFAIKKLKDLLKRNEHEIFCLELLNCWYYLNYVEMTRFFLGAPKACTAKEYYSYHPSESSAAVLDKNGALTPQSLRSIKGYTSVPVAGWHFTYLGGAEKIREKVQAFSHQEFNTEEILHEDNIAQRIKSGEDLFGRDGRFGSVKINYLMPTEIRRNKMRYSTWITDMNPMPLDKRLHLMAKYICESLPGLNAVYSLIKNRFRKGSGEA